MKRCLGARLVHPSAASTVSTSSLACSVRTPRITTNHTSANTVHHIQPLQQRHYTPARIKDTTPINADEILDLESELLSALESNSQKNDTTSHHHQHLEGLDDILQQSPSSFELQHHSTGVVTKLLGNIAIVSGLQSAHVGAFVHITANHAPASPSSQQLSSTFNTQLYGQQPSQQHPSSTPSTLSGVVLALTADGATVAIYNHTRSIKIGMKVEHRGEIPAIRYNKDHAVGQILDARAHPLHPSPTSHQSSSTDQLLPISVLTNTSRVNNRLTTYNQPIFTGLAAIDFFHPIAQGLNFGVFGTTNSGKTSIALDTVKHIVQNNSNVKDEKQKMYVVYVSIGKSQQKQERIISKLKPHMQYTTIFTSTPESTVTEQYLLPFTAVTYAEQLRSEGKNVFVVYDDLGTHASVYNALRRRCDQPLLPISQLHAQLLSRSAAVKSETSGQPHGSITSMILVHTDRPTQQNESERAEENQLLAGHVDHRVELNDKLRKLKVYPAISASAMLGRPAARFRSPITRHMTSVMSSLVLASEKTAASYEWARELNITQDIEEEDLAVIDYSKKLQILLHQPLGPQPLHQQFIMLHAACNRSLLSEIDLVSLPQFVRNLQRYIENKHSQLYQQLIIACQHPSEEMSAQIIDQLDEIVHEFELAFRQQ